MKLYIFIFITVAILFSCDKSYLDQRPLGQLDENSLSNQKGVERLLIAAYSLLDGSGGNKSSFSSSASNWIYGSICGTEAHTGSDDFDGGRLTVLPVELFIGTAASDCFASKWGTLYDGVQRSNDVLRIMEKATDIPEADRKRIAGETRFLRAFYHFDAKKIWNNVPFIDETVTYENGNYRVSNERNIWPDIEDDLKFAAENLPDNSSGTPGRVNKYTAMTLLAKAYLFEKKFDLAKPLLENIINSGNYELVNYHGNFNPETKNSKESILSAQTSVNDGSEGLNGNFGDALNFPTMGPGGGCCGFFTPSQYLVNHFKTDSTTGLPDLDNISLSDVINDQGIGSSESFTLYEGSLDPRLDWTIGRRGIPYLDWGNHTGKEWTRDQSLGGPYSPKKNVYYKSQVGKLTEVSGWSKGPVANNVNLIRYADVLLWAAETEAETGDFDKAREYVNMVRARAADPAGWVLKDDGTPAANYKIGLYLSPWTDLAFARKAIYYERMLELAMEGHRFFDLVRWGIAATEIKQYLQKEKNLLPYLNNADFKAGTNEYFPIPGLQIDLSAGVDGIPKMAQNPGY